MPKRPHLTLISDGLWPLVTGGMQTHSYYLVRYLTINGIHLRVYHPDSDSARLIQKYFSPAEWNQIEWIGLNLPKQRNFPGFYLWSMYCYAIKVAKHLKQNPPDTNLIYAKGLSAWVLKRPYPAPLYINIHGCEMFQPAPDIKHRLINRFVFSPLFRHVLNKGDALISYGPQITRILRRNIPEVKTCIELAAAIPAGHIKTELCKTHKPRKIVFLGRFEKRKGLHLLLEAMQNKTLAPQTADLECHIIGNIPSREQVVVKGVFYHGLIIERDTLFALLDDMDALICTSLSEGMPNVILEAMARGLAIITTGAGSVKDLLNAEEAIWINSWTVQSVTQAIRAFMQLSDQELQRLKLAAWSRAKNNFTWEQRIAETIEQLSLKNN